MNKKYLFLLFEFFRAQNEGIYLVFFIIYLNKFKRYSPYPLLRKGAAICFNSSFEM